MASVFKRKGRKGYRVKYRDEDGRWREIAGYSDRRESQRLGDKLEEDARKRRDGLIDADAEEVAQHARRSVEDHLKHFEASLSAAGKSEKHIRETCDLIRRVAKAIEATTSRQITADKVNGYAKAKAEAGASARTIQKHIRAIKQFTAWLATTNKVARDPLVGKVKTPDPKADRRRERRALSGDEWAWIRSTLAAEDAPEREGVDPAERLLLYATAIQTGLRASELRTLSRGSLYLDAKPPYVVVKGAGTKNRKDAHQYVKPELAKALKAHVKRKAPRAPVFAMPEEWKVADMLRADVAAARAAWLKAARGPKDREKREQSDFLTATDDDGKRLDFHCLRYTCGAWLAMAGVHPKVVQEVMRHSTITLTMDTYGHLFPGQVAEAVGKLPDMLNGHGERHQMRHHAKPSERSPMPQDAPSNGEGDITANA